MMRWWVDRGVDGFRMDVINLISKRPARCRTAPAPPGSRFGSSPAAVANGPRLHEFLAEMNREVGLSDRAPADRRRDARRRRSSWPAVSPTRPGASSTWCSPSSTSTSTSGPAAPSGTSCRPAAAGAQGATSTRWQEGLADAGWNSLYWNNHDQPRAVSRFGDDSPEHRVASAKTLGTCCTCTGDAVRLPGRGARDDERALRRRSAEYRDIESLRYHAQALEAGVPAETVMAALGRKGRDNARTPMQWDAGPHAGFTTGEPWLPVQPEPGRDQRRCGGGRPVSVFHHYRGADRAAPRAPARRRRPFDAAAARPRPALGVRATRRDRRRAPARSCSPTARRTPSRWMPPTSPTSPAPRCCSPRTRGATGLDLLPWESRVHELGARPG